MAFDYSVDHALRTQKKNWSCQKVYKRWAFDLMNSVPWSNAYNNVIKHVLRLCGEDFDFLSEMRDSQTIKKAVVKRLNYLIVSVGGDPMSPEVIKFILER